MDKIVLIIPKRTSRVLARKTPKTNLMTLLYEGDLHFLKMCLQSMHTKSEFLGPFFRNSEV